MRISKITHAFRTMIERKIEARENKRKKFQRSKQDNQRHGNVNERYAKRTNRKRRGKFARKNSAEDQGLQEID